jgi:hypothetical protein
MPRQVQKGRYEAPAAGAFGGIATLGLGQHIPDIYPVVKYVVIYGSPVLSLVYSAFVQMGFVWIIAKLKRRDMEQSLCRVRAIRDQASANPMSSPGHLKHLQANVEATERLASEIATASNAALVDKFDGISISDLIRHVTSQVGSDDPDDAVPEAETNPPQNGRTEVNDEPYEGDTLDRSDALDENDELEDSDQPGDEASPDHCIYREPSQPVRPARQPRKQTGNSVPKDRVPVVAKTARAKPGAQKVSDRKPPSKTPSPTKPSPTNTPPKSN